ncbi:hypothetical protein QZH41_009137 [Actinostola sp. cb2023]|nr:hypothetical protein QZH41_009137 [Actinostola sp. cb2023]
MRSFSKFGCVGPSLCHSNELFCCLSCLPLALFRFKKDPWLSPSRFKDYPYKNDEFSWEVLKLPGSSIVEPKTANARSWRMPSIPLPSPSYSTGRHTPYYTHPDIRIYELNRRLQQRTEVCTEGRLILEFTFDDIMRIRNWHFTVRQHREMVSRNVVVMQQDPAILEQVSKNVTRNGMTNFTLNYLRVSLCVILEPMQELMSRHKTYNMSPRDCLKSTLFQRWQRMCTPPGTEAVVNKYNQTEMMWPPNATTPGTPTKGWYS